MSTYRVEITYVGGSEVIDVKGWSILDAMERTLKTIRQKWTRTGVYNELVGLRIV